MRLLIVFLEEALPSQLDPSTANILGTNKAEVVYRATIRLLLTQLSGLERCHLRFCYRPADAHDAIRFWLLSEIIDHPGIHLDIEAIDFKPQSDGDLGSRISRAAENAFCEGYQQVALIGTNCIEISSRWIHATFAQLNKNYKAVTGEGHGGGCYLLAMREYLPSLCRQVTWTGSSGKTSILRQASCESYSLYQLPNLCIIETCADYQSTLSGLMGRKFRSAIEDILESA
ncbi:MAG: DUF2064 domain-containing protein [Roseibacillus sp.]